MGSFGFHCAECDLPMLSDGPTIDDCCFKCEEEFAIHEDGGGCKSTNYLLSPEHNELPHGMQETQLQLDLKQVIHYEEKDYQGYGVYGGKDAYALLAQTNIEAIREWYNDPEWVPTGDDEVDRHFGIDMCYEHRAKTHEEILKMIAEGITITKENIYHHAKDLIKNPIKIVCENCFSRTPTYAKCGDSHSRSHSNQSWTTAHNTEVGWVCEVCSTW